MSQPFDPNQPPPPPVPPQPQQPVPAQQPQQANPYAAAAPSPYQAAPQVNPYGGGQVFPGSKAYVEQNFGPVAGFGDRFLALLIDSLITLVGLIPMIIGIVLLIAGAPEIDAYGDTVDGTGDGGKAAIGGILIGVGILLMWGIHIWNRIFKMGRSGQSVGKKAMGLKLVNEQTGQPIGAAMAFGREVLSQIINQIFFLSNLWMLWDDNKQTLHDKIVHSTVIQVPKS